MQLSKEELDAIRRGESLRVTQAGTDLVILPADLFERLSSRPYDDSPWTDEEMNRLAGEDADSLGWEGMEAYQDQD